MIEPCDRSKLCGFRGSLRRPISRRMAWTTRPTFGPLFFVWCCSCRWPGRSPCSGPRACARRGGHSITSHRRCDSFSHYLGPLTNFFVRPTRSRGPSHPITPQWLGWTLHLVRPKLYLFNAHYGSPYHGVGVSWRLAWRVAPFLGWPRYNVAFLAARLLQRKRSPSSPSGRSRSARHDESLSA